MQSSARVKTDLETLLGSAGKMVQESREHRGTASPRRTDEQVGAPMPHPGVSTRHTEH